MKTRPGMTRLPAGSVLTVRYNAPDVKRDLIAWSRDRGHPIHDATAMTLRLTA